MIGGESFIQTFADDGRLVQETFSSYYITHHLPFAIPPPKRIATGGLNPNHAPPTNAVPAIATNHGSDPNGLPPCIAAIKDPICQNLYTAEKTSPTAAAFTPLSIARNHAREHRIRHRPMNLTTMKRPGAYIATKAITTPRYDGIAVPNTARALR